MSIPPDWLRNFFAEDNQIDLDRVLSLTNPYDPKFQDLLKPLVSSTIEGKWPLLLPVSRGGELYFYGAERDRRSLEELRQILQAVLGAADTYPEFPLIKVAREKIEQIILQQAPAGLLKVDLLRQSQSDFALRKRVFQALASVLDLYQQRPPVTAVVKRPVGRILRDFFAACQSRDGSKASHFFDELKTTGNFSQRNLISLELQAWEAERRWSDILGHPRLVDMLGGRMPAQLVRVLLRAIGNLGGDRLLEPAAFGELPLERIRLLCQPISPLFANRPPLETRECFASDWKLWAIGAGALGFSDGLDGLPDFVDPAWIRGLHDWANLPTKTPVAPTIAPIPSLLKVGSPQTFNDLRLVLEGSLSASMEELREIWVAVQEAPEELKNELYVYPRLQSVWQGICHLFDGSRELGWKGWLERLKEASTDPDALIHELQEESQSWSIESFSEAQLGQCLHGDASTALLLRDSLPLLLDWLDRRQILCSGHFWLEWLELLALDDLVNPSDVQLAGQIVQRFMSRPSHIGDRTRLGEALELLWEKGGSVSAYSEMLEIVELLLDETQPGQQELQKLWLVLQGFALSRWTRLELAQRFLTKSLAREIFGESNEASYPPLAAEEGDADFDVQTRKLSGRLLAIYSLTEGAARRAKTVLEGMFEGLRVELNHDHTATPALQNLAKKANYFLFVAGSAKHQAFYPVSRIRQDLIYPLGKGASSIIEAFCKSCVNSASE
ncbi:hypothetical protein AA098_03720 [Pseudomonas sp. JY-Q]|uniref:protein DpdD n=1 Tax=Pseudomonas sp. JY-Q TaxID=1338689 RepID=UPI0007DD37C7|nr:protein DpdD [Pseudomonas sp. JY-Q]ANI32656.1 hypothetical protein AA098_03720 [Pseudomonas sp. JY-Q]